MSGHSIEGLMNWMVRDEWIGLYQDMLDIHLGPSCEALNKTPDELASLVGVDAFNVLWGCIFEDLLTRDMNDGRNIVADYLKRRGFRETASSRAYMNGLRRSVMSLYEVSDVRPGESFLLRDLIRGGEPVRISERSGSKQLKNWTHVGARVVPVPTKTVIGGGLLVFDQPTSEALMKTYRRMRKTLRAEMTKQAANFDPGLVETINQATQDDTAVLSLLAPMFTEAWLDHRLEAILDPVAGRLSNTDGDDLLFVSARYRFKPGVTVKAVRAAIDLCPDLRRETANFWNWVDYNRSGRPKPAAKKKGLTIGAWLDDGATVLGTLEIRGRAVVLDANSATRHDAFRAMIEPLLEALVTEPEIGADSMTDILADAPAAQETATPSKEQKAAILDYYDQYYRGLLNEAIPALGGKTPVEAARTAAGRRKLVAWLKFMENAEASNAGLYDFDWMWEALGVAELRC